jgi:regulation of enolase protein 1 (concanavalin A-like superfamily)
MTMLNSNIGAQQSDSIKLKSIPFLLRWQNSPKNFSIKENQLAITAGPKTDMFRDPNVTYNTDNAPKLLFKPDENFILSVGIEHPFLSKWDGGAIVLWQDSLHWIKFCFEKDYTGAHRVVSVVTRDFSDDCNSIELKGNKVFYKVAKAEHVITLYYSGDGTKWYLIRHLEFEFSSDLQLGFLAQSPTGSSCTVKFSDLKYKNKKIKDPYIGE